MIGDVELARRGDKEAFIRLMRMLELSLYQTAKAFLHSDEDCADAMQETALRAYRSVRSLKNPEYLKTWIVRILINECKRVLEKKRNIVPLQPEYEPAMMDPGYARFELRELVDRLEAPQRSVVLLYYYGGLTVKEIAEELNVPEGTIKSRLYKAREILGTQYDRLSKGAENL
ncbi:RNA polymerase sigma factor [Cohnella mopanensis]|uniref:RNA polymerase sigma factor n=1 Tax=Cohnella mopanensis TaxID=2911966 RepID=UPI001EF7E444|nr:sigma-70 family RNA polymerase sigma factor [Cohnella mopanensis]